MNIKQAIKAKNTPDDATTIQKILSEVKSIGYGKDVVAREAERLKNSQFIDFLNIHHNSSLRFIGFDLSKADIPSLCGSWSLLLSLRQEDDTLFRLLNRLAEIMENDAGRFMAVFKDIERLEITITPERLGIALEILSLDRLNVLSIGTTREDIELHGGYFSPVAFYLAMVNFYRESMFDGTFQHHHKDSVRRIFYSAVDHKYSNVHMLNMIEMFPEATLAARLYPIGVFGACDNELKNNIQWLQREMTRIAVLGHMDEAREKAALIEECYSRLEDMGVFPHGIVTYRNAHNYQGYNSKQGVIKGVVNHGEHNYK